MDTRRRRCPLLVGAVVAAVCGAAAASPSLEVKTAQGRVAGESVGGGEAVGGGVSVGVGVAVGVGLGVGVGPPPFAWLYWALP